MGDSALLGILGFDRVPVYVTDRAAALRWYTDGLDGHAVEEFSI